MQHNLPTERPDILAQLNGLLERGVSTVVDSVVTDAIAEIEQLRACRDEWVNHGLDDIDRLDLDGLRVVLTLLSDRIDELLAEREHKPSVTAFGLGYDAGKRDVDPIEQLARDQEAGRIRRVNNTPGGAA